nr:MAG: nonstructural protein [Microvirus sp.]
MKIFAMFDTKANFYMNPFTETSTIVALRGFEVAVNDGKSTFNRFPDDFCLHELAAFDQNTGEISVYEHPQNLGSARTVLKQPQEQNSLPFPKAQ